MYCNTKTVEFIAFWSKLEKEKYQSYQTEFREALKGTDYSDAFEWGLEHWQKALDLYDKKDVVPCR